MKIKSKTIMVSLLKAGFAVPFMLVLSACDDSGSAANSEVLDNSSTSLYDEAQGKGEETDKRIEDGDRKSSSSIQKEEYSSSSEKEEYDFDGEVVFAYELPSCTVKKDEKTYYVRDEDAAYTCDYDDFFRKGEWIKENGLGEDDDWIYSSSSENAFVDCDGKVNSVYELPECTDKRNGKVYCVKDEGITHTCKYYANLEHGAWAVDPSTVVKGMKTDPRDGKVYKTVKIGSQTWMAENLNYRYLGNSSSGDSSSFCYNNEPDSCAKYGRLYTWFAAIGKTEEECGGGKECDLSKGNVQGICPDGWHLPSTEEWKLLFKNVGDSATSIVLKSKTGWYAWDGEDGNGWDDYGFTVLPALLLEPSGFHCGFKCSGGQTYFWAVESSDEYEDYSSRVGFSYNSASGGWFNHGGQGRDGYGYSVRCLLD